MNYLDRHLYHDKEMNNCNKVEHGKIPTCVLPYYIAS